MTNLKNVGAFIKKCCNVFVVRGLTETTEPTCLQGEKKLTEARGEIAFHGGFLANLVYVGHLCYCLNDAVYQEAI